MTLTNEPFQPVRLCYAIPRHSAAAVAKRCQGIEVHEIERQRVRVYGVAKTIADLFKARNRVGLDVAMEALRDA